MYIYADILIITNIYIDYLLIHAAKALTHSPMKKLRGIIAAVIGSLFSLVIFLPKSGIILTVLFNLISAVVIVYTAFGYGNKRTYLKRLFIYFMCSFVFAGAGTMISYLSHGRILISRNGILYADFSVPTLIITSSAAYIAVEIYRRSAYYSAEGEAYLIIVRHKGRSFSFKAMADTGNILCDSFTGKPVIVCGSDTIEEIYGIIPDIYDFEGSTCELKWRFIPYHTASGTGMMPIICPEEVYIKNIQNGAVYRADVYLGASLADTAVFHPRILV